MGLVLILVVLGGLATVVIVGVRAVTGRDESTDAGGIGIRRFFQYALMYGLLIVAGTGLSGLLSRLFSDPALVTEGSAGLARAVTFTIIGVPLYLALATWSMKRLLEDRAEVSALGWQFYVTLATLTALVAAMIGAYDVIAALLSTDRFDGASLVSFLVWGSLWALHWIGDRRLSHRQSQLHLLAGSLIGLAVGATGLVGLIAAAIDTLIGPAGSGLTLTGGALGRATATAAVGGAVWLVYWLFNASVGERTTLWLAYVLPIGVGAGLLTALSAASVLLYQVLVWVIGEPSGDNAAAHFAELPGVLGAVVVGATVWWYHRTILAEGRGEVRTEVGRVYEYVMAGIGLMSAAGGLTAVIVAVFEALTGGRGLEVGVSPVNTLLGAATMLAVGAPVWWIFWSDIQRETSARPEQEVVSPSRRVYLFVLLGLGGVLAVVALLTAMYLALTDLFEGRFGSETVRSMRVPLALIITTGTLAGYHWAIYRADQLATPAAPVGHLRHVLLVGEADSDIVAAVAAATGARVQLWHRTDGQSSPWAVAAILESLGDIEGPDVMVVAGPDGLTAMPIARNLAPLRSVL